MQYKPSNVSLPEFGGGSLEPPPCFAYVERAVESFLPPLVPDLRILDIACGNAHWLARFGEQGCHCVGIDASAERVRYARRNAPQARIEHMEITPDVVQCLDEGPFDLVISTEVVEHLFLPHQWAVAAFQALRPGGRFISSTPYHGYFKNLAISVFNAWDRHHNPLRDLGHIKFWSPATLTALLTGAGFTKPRIRGAGRLPLLWKSMVAAADRPEDPSEPRPLEQR